MRSITSVGHSLYRIVFRRGSPERLQYSPVLMQLAFGSALALIVAAELVLYASSGLQVAVSLFVGLTGLAIAGSWLTAKMPRRRLRLMLLAVVLLLALAAGLLLVVGLLPTPARAVPWATGIVGALFFVGAANCVRYGLGSSWLRAALYTFAFFSLLALMHLTLVGLLEVVFAA